MKLRHKKTGEIVYATMMASYGGGELQIRYYPVNNAESTHFKEYRSISELNAEWEDYEEPKGKALYWMILTLKNFIENEPDDKWVDLEDCKQMLKKLKVWQRLKDKGFEFERWTTFEKATGKACFDKGVAHSYYVVFTFRSEDRLEKDEQTRNDLDLLFGGEE